MLKNIEETNQPIYSPNNISLSVMKIIYAEIIFSNEELSEKKLIEILNEEIIKILLKKLIENSLIENYGNSNEITDKLMIAKNDDQSFYKNTKKILNMVVEKIGFISLDKLLKEIQKYERLRKFENEFEDLVIRFSRIRKTKEEKVKYLVRKSLKYLKNKFVFKGSSKDKFQNFVNHYFGKENSNMILKNENFKLINNEFLRKIFSSELFKKEFKEFLGIKSIKITIFKILILNKENDNFEKIVKLDNKSKINLLSAKILSFLKKSENEVKISIIFFFFFE